MGTEADELAGLVGSVVILDTATPLVYIGKLEAWQEGVVLLTDADVHDVTEGRSTKDMYALEARRHGVQRNRARVAVRRDQIVSVSRFDDVVLY